jgi:hypothetical protein
MTELIASGSLGAFDAQNITLMGMPNIGAEYTSHTGKKAQHRLDDNAICCCCGQRATNGHHLVPKGMGGGRKVYERKTDMGCFNLFSPIFAVCGMGNSSGCHGKFHHQGGFLKADWAWDSPESYDLWDTGELWRKYKPNSGKLYQLGFWIITDGDKTLEVRG